MSLRRCSARTAAGQPCLATPMADAPFCFWHSPEHAPDRAEAARLGGLRRKREGTVATAYDLGGVQRLADLQRLLEIATLDTVALENSLGRNRTIAYLVMAAVRLLEVGEHEQRLSALEAAVTGQPALAEAVFDTDPDEGDIVFESAPPGAAGEADP